MHTPNIDALASRSILFRQAYVQFALCSPSRSSFLTGRRPDTTRVYDLVSYFRETGGHFTTLPQYFKEHGYRSIGMGKIFHPGKASGGFNSSDTGDDIVSWSEPYFHGKSDYETHTRSWLAVPDEDIVNNPLLDRQTADHAKQTLQRIAPNAKSGNEHFFMAVGFRRPHLPFVFPKSVMDTYYPMSSIQLPSNSYAPVVMPSIAWQKAPELTHYQDFKAMNFTGAQINVTLPDDVVLNLRRAYYSAVTYMDSLVGEVLAELNKLGLSPDTVVVFAGDHGWQLGEHGEWCKTTNFEVATHAPLMLHIQNVTDNGVVTDQLVEFVDIYPTVVEAAGLGTLPRCQGTSTDSRNCQEGLSLLSLIASPNKPLKKAAFTQVSRKKQNIVGYSVRTDKFRYTEWIGFNFTNPAGQDWDTLSAVELYDHSIDPEENVNRASYAEYTNERTQLRQLLRGGWVNAIEHSSAPGVIG